MKPLKHVLIASAILALGLSAIVAYATITNNDRRISHTANGSTTVFAYDFIIAASTELDVTLTQSNGTITTYTTANYSVSGVGAAGGGNITFTTAPPAGTLVILGNATLEQTFNQQANAAIVSSSLNGAFDRLEKQIQQLFETLRRAPRFPKASSKQTIYFQDFSSSDDGKCVVWDNDTTSLLASACGAGANLTVTSFIQTLLDDADQAAAQTTLGIVNPAGTYLPLAGGTMAGSIAMGGNTITGSGDITMNGAATVDGTDISGLSLANLPTAAAASISANSQKITNLATPTAATDAATKGYVDGLSFSGAMTSRTAAVSPASGVQYEVAFNVADNYDTDAYHDPAGANPERFTAPATGYYHLTCSISFASNTTGYRWVLFRVNGTDIDYGGQLVEPTDTTQTHVTAGADFPLTIGDYVTCSVIQTSGGALGVCTSTYGCWFQIHRIK